MLDFLLLAEQCAPTVAPQTMAAIVQVESTFNPYAIGVVGGVLQRQPQAKNEAVETAKALEADGWNFSLGIAQVNRHNLPKYGLSYEEAFDPCENMRVGSLILEDCYTRALPRVDGDEQRALQSAFSCYYSGNFTRGFQPDVSGKPSYVEKVLAQADVEPKAIPIVPSISSREATKPQRVRAATAASPTPAARTPSGPPVDHAPVLLQRVDAPATATVVTHERGQVDAPVTNEGAKPAAQAASSSIVF